MEEGTVVALGVFTLCGRKHTAVSDARWSLLWQDAAVRISSGLGHRCRRENPESRHLSAFRGDTSS